MNDSFADLLMNSLTEKNMRNVVRVAVWQKIETRFAKVFVFLKTVFFYFLFLSSFFTKYWVYFVGSVNFAKHITAEMLIWKDQRFFFESLCLRTGI